MGGGATKVPQLALAPRPGTLTTNAAWFHVKPRGITDAHAQFKSGSVG